MVATGFYILTLIMFFSVFVVISKSPKKQKLILWYVVGFIIWIVYLQVISGAGILDSFELPPRVALLVVIPIIAIILFISTRRGFLPILQAMPQSFPIYIQSFRIIVEFLIFGAYLNGIFSKQVTFEGTNFDILVGASAPIIGFLAQKGILKKKGILIWNIAGLLVLFVTVFTFIYTYYFMGFGAELEVNYLARMPYLLLASVLMPCAVFFHAISIRQQMNFPSGDLTTSAH